MHRDDKAALEVKMVLIRHEDGTQDRVPAVLTPEEPIQDRYERLANKIRHKATRPYRQNLRHLNLVIRDRCNTMGNKKERYSVSALMNSGVRDTLLAGPFREVYWITVIEGTGEQVYRPLRLLMIFEYFWIFCHGLKSWHTAPENLTPQDVVILFVDYCNRLHMDVQLLVENGKMWALNEGIAVSIDENGAQISDNRDFPHPGGQVQPRSTKLPELTDSQYASATEHFNATDFSTELYYTAEVPATLRHPAITAVKLRRVGDGNAEPPSSQRSSSPAPIHHPVSVIPHAAVIMCRPHRSCGRCAPSEIRWLLSSGHASRWSGWPGAPSPPGRWAARC